MSLKVGWNKMISNEERDEAEQRYYKQFNAFVWINIKFVPPKTP